MFVNGKRNRKPVTCVPSLPGRRESAIEAKFSKSCRRYGGTPVKLGHSGYPDQLVLWDKGVTTYAEIKRPGEEPEPHQEEKIKELRDKGHLVWVIHNEAEMAQFISESLQRVVRI